MKDYAVDKPSDVNFRCKDAEITLGFELKVIVSEIRSTQFFSGRWKSDGSHFTLEAEIDVLVRNVLEHVQGRQSLIQIVDVGV